jgi:hypothetical protein
MTVEFGECAGMLCHIFSLSCSPGQEFAHKLGYHGTGDRTHRPANGETQQRRGGCDDDLHPALLDLVHDSAAYGDITEKIGKQEVLQVASVARPCWDRRGRPAGDHGLSN